MFDTNGINIRLPRGDSAVITFDLTDEDTGQPYFLDTGQYAVFSVFPFRGADAVISKTVTVQTDSGGIIVSLVPSDTDITPGEYIYTLRLFNADGTEIDTFRGGVETAAFEVI